MYDHAATIIKNATRVTAFTGAGISVESGIPPFRGKNGLWNTYDPMCLDIDYFYRNRQEAWKVIKEIFYDFFGQARPNAAHKALALMEEQNVLQTVITQNIDNLHQEAGSKAVYEFHGTSQYLVCLECSARYHVSQIDLDQLPPMCPSCDGLLKPDFVFFGEPIPEFAHTKSFLEAQKSDVFLVISTTGEVMPASLIPGFAKQHGATIIEINLHESHYTHQISEIFLQGQATEVMTQLLDTLEISESFDSEIL